MLSTKNLKMAYKGAESKSHKLMPKFCGPFTVDGEVGRDAYKLRLPPAWKIHPVFHVSLLTPYKHDAHRIQPPPDPTEVDGDIEFFIDHIVSHSENKRTGKRMFKVRWRGYPPDGMICSMRRPLRTRRPTQTMCGRLASHPGWCVLQLFRAPRGRIQLLSQMGPDLQARGRKWLESLPRKQGTRSLETITETNSFHNGNRTRYLWKSTRALLHSRAV